MSIARPHERIDRLARRITQTQYFDPELFAAVARGPRSETDAVIRRALEIMGPMPFDDLLFLLRNEGTQDSTIALIAGMPPYVVLIFWNIICFERASAPKGMPIISSLVERAHRAWISRLMPVLAPKKGDR